MGQHESPRLDLTTRERTMVDTLRRLRTTRETPEAARRAIDQALAMLSLGRRIGRFHDAADVDAHLAVVRTGLLERLSRMAPPHELTLGYLLSLGDAAPGGWTVALPTAAIAAVGPERPPAWRWDRSREVPRAESVVEALRHCPDDAGACAVTPDRIVFPAAGVQVTLTTAEAEPGRASRASRPPEPWRCAIQFLGPLRTEVAWPTPDDDQWGALRALAGGLFAVDRMALPVERRTRGRDHLQRALCNLLVAVCEGPVWASERAVVEHAAQCIEDERPDHNTRQRHAEWPCAYALVVGALDRLAGRGAEPFAHAPEPGTWVQRIYARTDKTLGWGVVLDWDAQPDEAERARHRRRPAATNAVPVLIRGGVVLCRPSELLSGPRAQLFG